MKDDNTAHYLMAIHITQIDYSQNGFSTSQHGHGYCVHANETSSPVEQ